VTVTDIIPIDSKRSKIFLDGEFAFALYKGEIFSLSITVGENLSEDTYNEIIGTILPKRCKLRAMHLLEKKQYTRHKLRQKLVEGLYPEDAVDEAIKYVESFHYVDDELYARDYILSQMASRSEKDILMRLKERGIGEEVFEKVKYGLIDDGLLSEDDEVDIIVKHLKKKGYDSDLEFEQKQKIMAYLYRKGFASEKIKRAVERMENDEAYYT